MSFINIEIKAKTNDPAFVRQFLLDHGADFKGTDQQTDTYFNVASGRLKLRQGSIENNLIYYERPDQAGPKQSDFKLVPVNDGDALKMILSTALGIKVTVVKKREIYFIGNVKFHIDQLEGLGSFIEIEAGNKKEPVSLERLHEQCTYYLKAFNIREEDLIQHSYSDMLLGLSGEQNVR